MKKIVLGIFVLLACMSTIFAYSGGQEGEGSAGGDSEQTSGSTAQPYPYLAGVRISFVRADGTNLASKDYILDEHFNYVASKNWSIHVTNQMCSRIGYTGGTCSYSSFNSIQNIQSFAEPLSNFENFFTVNGYTFPIKIRSSVSNLSYTNAFTGLYNVSSFLPTDVYSENIQAVFDNLLSSFGIGKLEDYKVTNETDTYDIFMVFEHTTLVKVQNTYYYGNTYELANIARNLPSGGGGFSSCPAGHSLGALCDLSSVIASQLPCSSRLDRTFYNSVVSTKPSYLSAYFNSETYFNGAIKIYDSAASICNSGGNIFDKGGLDGNYGIGMGFIWIGQLLNDDYNPGPEDPDPEPPSGKFNCTPIYNIGTCLDGDSIFYLDSAQGNTTDEYWNNCVFNDKGYYSNNPHKSSNKNSALTYYEPGLGSSDYCEVYCIESLTTNFASGNITVEAGSRFIWGDSYATGGRTCRTKSVNWSKFDTDLKKANQSISNSYADWRVEQQLDKITWTKSSQKDCDWGCIGTMTDPCHDAVYDPITGELIKEDSMKCCSEEGYQDYSYTPSKTYVSFSVSGEFPAFKSASVSTVCGIDSVPTYDPDSKENTYYKAIDYADSLVQDMKKCYNWPESSIYNTNPQAVITYGDGKNYYYSGNMDVNTSYSLTDNSICSYQNVSQIKGCKDNSCPSTTVLMKNCGGTDRYVEMTRTATTIFSLNADIFRYVLKSNNLSIHRFDLPKYSNSNFTTNYYDVGEPNFPVSYSIPDGVYGSMHGRGNLDLTYSNLGHLKAGQTKTDVDNILSTAESSNYGKWQCEFTVYSDLIPDPNNPDGGGNGLGGIRVVYRTIDLVDPFPDIDGSKRNTGSNWCSSYGDCSYNNNVVKAYINNNRGVSDYDIYSGEPMYTFILTPSIIKEIRKYNSTNSYAEYTGSLAGKNYDYKCNDGSSTGKYCISDYLSYLINITGAKDQPGSCVDDKYRNYNDTGNFNACRY